MAFDAHKNLAIATVATAPSPASSGTTLTVGAGEGARFPAAPFNATVWPADLLPDPTTAEVVRVTARATDTLMITRVQEGTTARTIVAGDLIAATITAKSLTDIESGVNFPQLATAGNLSVAGGIRFANLGTLSAGTNDGADTGQVQVSGGGATGVDRGAFIATIGNEAAGLPGCLQVAAGNVAGGGIIFYTGPAAERGRIHQSGGFSWGGTTDPGAGCFTVGPGTPFTGGQTFTTLTPGAMAIGQAGTAAVNVVYFYNGNGFVGSIQTTGAATAYLTTSDARLKTPLYEHTNTAVLRDTVIHNFLWKSDGTQGRGVFAQEAQLVAPFAVSVGSDEVDDQGRLTKPWGVDYSKYVPDLITGWQHHDALIQALLAEVTRLEVQAQADSFRDTKPEASPSVMHRLRTWIAAWMPAWITP